MGIHMKLIDISGNKYSRLTVLYKHDKPSKSGGSLWRCVCDCGNHVVVNSSNLKNGSTKSCGCLGKEWSKNLGSDKGFIKKRSKKITKHGHKTKTKKTREYETWLSMKSRCNNPKQKDYKNYGARGITVCPRWNLSFSAFLEDMGEKPKGHCIDRIDVNGNYEPKNCRWAPLSISSGEHRRDNIIIEHKGKRYESLASACRDVGIPLTRAHYRMRKGMPIEKVLSTERLSRWDQ